MSQGFAKAKTLLEGADVVDDTSPQLGGNLDVNGNKIVSVSNGDIDIEPNGTGNVLLGNYEFDADQTVGAGQDNYVLTYDNGTGHISLEAASGGGGSGGGILLQSVYEMDATENTSSTAIPNDDTKPQNTEGSEWNTISITPTATNNIIHCKMVVMTSANAGGIWQVCAMFKDSDSDAIATSLEYGNIGFWVVTHTLDYWMVAPSTTTITFKVRAGGGSTTQTVYNNSVSTFSKFDGTFYSTYLVEEYDAS